MQMLIALSGKDKKLADRLQALFQSQRYKTISITSSQLDALDFSQQKPDLVFYTGTKSTDPLLHWIGRLKSRQRELPIFVFRPRASASEVVKILDAGADDCMCGPLKPHLLLARVRVLLRRLGAGGALRPGKEPMLSVGPIALDLLQRSATVEDRPLSFTHIEFELLAYFLQNAGASLKRETLLEAIWRYPPEVETRTLDRFVSNLRKKLGNHGELIETIINYGYRLKIPS